MARSVTQSSMEGAGRQSIAFEVARSLEFLLAGDGLASGPVRRCLELEHGLARCLFQGLPVGSTLTDLFGSLILRNTHPTGIRSNLVARAKSIHHYFRGAERPTTESASGLDLPPGKILVALISSRQYHHAWVPEVVSHLGGRETVVLSDDPALRGRLPEGCSSSAWRNVRPLDLGRWRPEYHECAPKWARHIAELGRRFSLSKTAQQRIREALMISSQRIVRYQDLLGVLQPSAVLVEYDRNVRGSSLVLAARQRGIPTLTLIHGVINSAFGFTPVLADTALCWGEIQQRQLAAFGTDERRIETVGFERIDPTHLIEGNDVRCKLGLPEAGLVAMLATNPIGKDDRMRLVTAFGEGVEDARGIHGVVRLHPSERSHQYATLAMRFPNVRFLENQELSQREAFSLADVVVVQSSGFGAEAMGVGKLCVVLDVCSHPLGCGMDLIEEGGAPHAGDGDQLHAILSKILSDSRFRSELQAGVRRFSERMFAATGKDACRNIAAAVQRRAARHGAEAP